MKKFTIRCIILCCLSLTIGIAQEENYDWSQVRIGGGGYITGIKIHPKNNKLRYFRTDVGGAYRWDDSKKEMVQMLNYAADKKNYYGVAGIALHPTKQNIVYLAVDRGNTTATSKILYSQDYGRNWREIDVVGGIKFGANGGREGGTGIDDRDREGSPLAINPANTNELWVGTREKGVWVLDLTKPSPWRKIMDIPDNNKEASIRAIVFHPKKPRFIFIAYPTLGIYRSSNSGASFKLMNNGSNDLKLVSDLSISKSGRKLYAAVRNKGVYRIIYPATSAPWKKLNLPFANLFKGYQTVTASPFNDNIVVASPAASTGNNLGRLQVSKDAGNTWVTKSNTDIATIFKWRDIGSAGAYTSQIAFDSSNPNKLYVSCWFGLWHTDDYNAARVKWRNNESKGHEEVVTTGLDTYKSHGSNNVLAVSTADYPGVIIKNPDSYENTDIRSLMDDDSKVVKGQDIAICDTYPSNFVVSATNEWVGTANKPSYGALLFTKNGGKSYTRLNSYNRNWGKSLVGTSTRDPNNIVVAHGKEVHYSRNRGTTFLKANIPSLGNVVENNVFIQHRPLANDLVLNHTFYLYDRTNGAVYRSRNAGKDWFKTKNNLPVDGNAFTSASLQPTPGKGGHLWFNHPKNGLFLSTNRGDSWIRLSSVKKARTVALGKEISAGAYPTIYMVGVLTGSSKEGIYRSTDRGRSWVEISDKSTQFLLSNPRHMAADRNEFGKLYLGVGGFGVWQGAVAGKNVKIANESFTSTELESNLKSGTAQIRLYPVPTDNVLHIDKGKITDKIIQWQLFDSYGTLRKEGVGDEIDLTEFADGIYFVNIQSDESSVIKKIIKQ